MFKDLTAQSLFIGVLASFVGFASSFAVVLNGLTAVGATGEQAASGLMAAAIAMGLCGIVLSTITRLPISIAWSTPGAALLVISSNISGGFSAAVGAFIICGALIFIAGIWRPFGKIIAAIPASLANAMLAGILLSLCLAPFKAIAFDPWLGLPLVIAWFIGGRLHRFLGIPFALLAFITVVKFGVDFPTDWASTLSAAIIPKPVWVMPSFNINAILSITLPLFIVTMASQNIPGFAVLQANDYHPKHGPLIATTGLFSLLSAPFGSHAVNLAAITAAMLAGEEAGPEHHKRYMAAIVCGIGYILFGLFAGITVSFVSLAPKILIEAVAGLALIGAFTASSLAAFKEEEYRTASAITFLASASGISLWGISGAFWGLIAGSLMVGLNRLAAKR